MDKYKWHNMETHEVADVLHVNNQKGLDNEEAKQRLNEYGYNKLPESKKKSPLIRFLVQFNNVLIYLLLISAVVTALMGHLVDTFVIFGVVFINAVVGFIQEGKAEKALDGIKKMLSLNAIILREGKIEKINSEELVPGDVVILKAGDKVPADIRLFFQKDLRVEESPLTGESTDVSKDIRPIPEDSLVGDKRNMVFSGTLITYGEAKGIVTGTGEKTEIGKITKMISEVERITTPLIEKMDRFAKYLSVFILLIAAVFFTFGYLIRENTAVEMFLTTVSLVVAAIPEGLPAVMTIALATGVQKMAKRNAIVRRLPSVETLGAVNVICSDKTGTLTKNEMTAKDVVTAERRYLTEGTGYNPEGRILFENEQFDIKNDPVLELLIKAAKICNDSDIKKGENGQWQTIGTATEGALITLAHKAGYLEEEGKRIDSIPFESSNKFMATLNEIEGEKYVFFKGAPERILEYCDREMTITGTREINPSCWHESMEKIAEKGQRVIALAYKKANDLQEIKVANLGNDFVFLGFVGIIDPPREEALQAIKDCTKAGIRVIMITGDHAITAKAISNQIGISKDQKVVTGKELQKMNDDELKEVVMQSNVFARTEPEHKLKLVKALQENGLLCAMTGDGVNDAPALKRANIGVAMGIKGTEVSKEAAEIVLTDDNFATIVNAVEEGRTVYDNIRKTILFILPTNGAEALVLMAAIILGVTLPITPVQILWINMVTAVTLALALVFEPMERQVMEKPPRDKNEPIFSKYFIIRTIFVSSLIGFITFYQYNYFYDGGTNLDYSRTVAVNMLAAGQAFYLLNCRKIHETTIGKGFFDNKAVFISMGILLALQLFFTYMPFMNTFFGTAPIKLSSWLFPLIGGLAVFFIIEIEKIFTKNIDN